MTRSDLVEQALRPVIHTWVDPVDRTIWYDRFNPKEIRGTTACGLDHVQPACAPDQFYDTNRWPLCPRCREAKWPVDRTW